MYGMINRAIKDLVCSKFGLEAWEKICERAGVDVDVWVGNESYPDATTYGLVTAASEVLEIPASSVLAAFGEHWVLETTRREYGGMIEAGGRTYREFLLNLPNFHARIELIFPRLVPPSFRVTDVQPDSLRLHYLTQRAGLQPFVAGILRGLAKLFRDDVEIDLVESRELGAEHDVFLLRWRPGSEQVEP